MVEFFLYIVKVITFMKSNIKFSINVFYYLGHIIYLHYINKNNPHFINVVL